jgi:hypothetical protein
MSQHLSLRTFELIFYDEPEHNIGTELGLSVDWTNSYINIHIFWRRIEYNELRNASKIVHKINERKTLMMDRLADIGYIYHVSYMFAKLQTYHYPEFSQLVEELEILN